MMHTDCCTWTKIHSTSRSLVVWLRNFMRRRQQRFNSNSVAQWIRRWSTEPEILGLIPSSRVVTGFYYFFLPWWFQGWFIAHLALSQPSRAASLSSEIFFWGVHALCLCLNFNSHINFGYSNFNLKSGVIDCTPSTLAGSTSFLKLGCARACASARISIHITMLYTTISTWNQGWFIAHLAL